jgi:uncharacterized protein YkwD
MKADTVKKFITALSLTGFMVFGGSTAALADASPPAIERTRAWDSIEQTLGGVPDSVLKIEYAGSVFYLGEGVTAEDCVPILEAGPEVPLLKAAKDSGVLYSTPTYILWNADKSVLLVHPLFFDHADILKASIIPAGPPAGLTGDGSAKQTSWEIAPQPIKTPAVDVTPLEGMTEEQTAEYMLSVEYADAVRDEFYRILNEHRAANGLRELEINLELQAYADIRAAELRTRPGHVRPDNSPAGSGWYGSKNNINSRYAENVAGTGSLGGDPKDTAKCVFEQWENSPGHNSHMLYDFNPDITMAFGIAPELDGLGMVSSGAVFATGY